MSRSGTAWLTSSTAPIITRIWAPLEAAWHLTTQRISYRQKNSWRTTNTATSKRTNYHETRTSHLGRFSLVASGRIDNLEELTRELLGRRLNFAELSASRINPTELVATLVSLGDSFREGIELVQSNVKGSCSMLILNTEDNYASRDKYGLPPVVVRLGDPD